MQFVPFEDGIEVSGKAVKSFVDGFNHFSVLGSAFLLDEGIGRSSPRGLAILDSNAWYSQRACLLSLRQISRQLGDGLLMQIGQALVRNTLPLEGLRDIHDAIKAIDMSYHMSHRKNGQRMFDPETGRMEEGIGHYGYEPVPGQRKILSLCETPYPCAIDHGVLTAAAHLHEPGARVTHAESLPCRKRQGNSCTYVISW